MRSTLGITCGRGSFAVLYRPLKRVRSSVCFKLLYLCDYPTFSATVKYLQSFLSFAAIVRVFSPCNLVISNRLFSFLSSCNKQSLKYRASAHKEGHQRNTPLKALKVSTGNGTCAPLTVIAPKQTAYKKSSRVLKGKYNTAFFSEAKILHWVY